MYTNVNNDYKVNIKQMIPDEGVKEIMIAIHGFAGDMESSAITAVAEELNKNGIGVVALDLPGHGVSEVDGDYLTINNCLSDIKCVENYIKENYEGVKINIFATSFGAYLALLLLTKYGNTYNKIILRCPAIKMDEIFVNEILNDDMETFKNNKFTIVGYERELKVNYSYYEELKNNQIITDFNARCDNMIIIHGDEDTTAPLRDAVEFANKFNVPIKIVKGADHRFKKPGELEQVVKYSLEFMKN